MISSKGAKRTTVYIYIIRNKQYHREVLKTCKQQFVWLHDKNVRTKEPKFIERSPEKKGFFAIGTEKSRSLGFLRGIKPRRKWSKIKLNYRNRFIMWMSYSRFMTNPHLIDIVSGSIIIITVFHILGPNIFHL